MKRKKSKKEPSWKKGLRAAKRARAAARKAGKKRRVKGYTRTTKVCRTRKKRVKGYSSFERGAKKRAKRRSKKRSRAKRTGLTKHEIRVRAGKKAARTRKRRTGMKAAAPRRRAKKRGKKRARSGMTKHEIRVRAGKKAARTRKANRRGGKKRSSSYGARRRSAGKRKNSKRVRAARAAARRRSIESDRDRHIGQNASERRRRRRGRRRQNPLSGMETFIGAITAAFGFIGADLLDRYIATHALTVTTNKDAAGHIIYQDTPPTTGQYVGLFNGAAVVAPMDWQRWLGGGLVTLVPLGLAFWPIKGTSPKLRASMQMFAFGAGARWIGKGLIDAMSALFSYTCFGQRLYDPEIRARALVKVNGNLQDASLTGFPSAGLGRPRINQIAPSFVRQLTAGTGQTQRCGKCGKTGVGACCGTIAGCCPPAQAPAGATPILTSGQQPAPATPPARPPQTVSGVPADGLAAPRMYQATTPNPFGWGSTDQA